MFIVLVANSFLLLLLQIDLKGYYWIKAITHLQAAGAVYDDYRENIRVYVGEYPCDPINPLFPAKLCHTTEQNVVVPLMTRYNCTEVLFGKHIYMDIYGKLNSMSQTQTTIT